MVVGLKNQEECKKYTNYEFSYEFTNKYKANSVN